MKIDTRSHLHGQKFRIIVWVEPETFVHINIYKKQTPYKYTIYSGQSWNEKSDEMKFIWSFNTFTASPCSFPKYTTNVMFTLINMDIIIMLCYGFQQNSIQYPMCWQCGWWKHSFCSIYRIKIWGQVEGGFCFGDDEVVTIKTTHFLSDLMRIFSHYNTDEKCLFFVVKLRETYNKKTLLGNLRQRIKNHQTRQERWNKNSCGDNEKMSGNRSMTYCDKWC